MTWKKYEKNYFYLKCSCNIGNQTEFVRSMFVRPENTQDYKEIGIDYFKIAERLKSTRWLVNAKKAYNDQQYRNLADILTLFSQYDYPKKAAKKSKRDIEK